MNSPTRVRSPSVTSDQETPAGDALGVAAGRLISTAATTLNGGLNHETASRVSIQIRAEIQ